MIYTGGRHFVQVVDDWRKCRHYPKGYQRFSEEPANVFLWHWDAIWSRVSMVMLAVWPLLCRVFYRQYKTRWSTIEYLRYYLTCSSPTNTWTSHTTNLRKNLKNTSTWSQWMFQPTAMLFPAETKPWMSHSQNTWLSYAVSQLLANRPFYLTLPEYFYWSPLGLMY